MKQSKFNFATVFSLMVLLAFSYIAFMGLVYWREGDVLLPAAITVAFIAIVIVCIIVMCRSKATRWRRIGTIGQAVFGAVILVAFVAAAIPFTNFMDVLAKQKRFSTEIDNMLESATQLDEQYQQYVERRISDYKDMLTLVSNGQSIRPTEYLELLGNVRGSSDRQKIEKLAESLRLKLLPDSMSEVQQERLDWIESASSKSVWNISLPRNIAAINEQVSHWENIYAGYSDFRFKGETAEPFYSEDFESDLQSLTNKYTRLHAPSPLAISIALLCFFIMLLPYWMTERDVAGRTSKGVSVYE